MTTRTRRPQRRNQVLSQEQIIEASIELLDAGGESGLTTRALTERLSTGSGAIYYRVGSRDELLDMATETVVTAALAAKPAAAAAAATPEDKIRSVALALFDAIAEHQWLATRLTLQIVRKPFGPVMVGIFERIGRQVGALGVPQVSWFDATATLVHYILGAVSQNARIDGDTSTVQPSRAEFLGATATAWQDLAPEDYPFMHAIVGQIREHDDREQFLTGIAIVLDGLTRLG
ncbi:TetR/AcrR family transcriptional regulator C-terminal domain-containing protein [Streptomyces sp. NBC_00378]|uniref:TetR/AcrR family transcriptional regulator n=1 Tax=unclassified Streptomyces TaxID=2593676 RepID=UPI0022587E54|nr:MULTISPECIES: TetR/AcrR family transcriptional regulator C-terminal domain-containing protein [unclassified Streptomyces]MCX5112465.1 TetR/AcrR family transcriptional regulator C-terminal domain-containing protein [Streptomyces sp. NBC_00378]